MESTGTLTVQAHDLGERLRDDHLESLVHEVSEALTILVEVASHETLVGSVKEWIQTVCLAHSCDLLPLVKSWINASWIVGASVEQDAGAWRGVLQVFDHAVEIETLGLLVEVTV